MNQICSFLSTFIHSKRFPAWNRRCGTAWTREMGLLSPNEMESDKDSEIANNGKAWTIRGSHCLCCAAQPKQTNACLHLLLKAAPLPPFAGYCRPLSPLANSILKCLSTQTVQKCHNYMLCVLIIVGATCNNTFQKYRPTFTFPMPGFCPCCAFLEASVVRSKPNTKRTELSDHRLQELTLFL